MKQHWFLYKAFRALFRFFLVVFFDFKAYGTKNIPLTGGVLMVANHESYLDPALVGVAVPRIMAFMAKSELFENRYFGWLIRRWHAFPVKQGRGDIGAMKQTIERLKEGNILNIFPEGSRSEDGKLQEIQSGAALVIRRAKVPVVPAIIAGSHESWPRTKKFPTPSRLRVIYGKPMILHELSSEEITKTIDRRFHELLDELHAIIDREDRPWDPPKSKH